MRRTFSIRLSVDLLPDERTCAIIRERTIALTVSMAHSRIVTQVLSNFNSFKTLPWSI
jgi:hypothetical protein